MSNTSIFAMAGPLGVLIGVVLVFLSGVLIEQLVHYISWRYQRAKSGVAAIFAPLITSAPELAVFTVAILQGELEVAWGSIVAQPFMAATIIYPVVLLTTFSAWVAGKRRNKIPHVTRDIAVPLIAFTLPLLPILFLHPEKYGVIGRAYGVLLLVLYVIYAKYMLREEEVEEPEGGLWLKNSLLQTFVAILSIATGAEFLVAGIVELGVTLGVDKTALAVIIIPIASVIPESIVGLIFLFKGQDNEGVSAMIGEKALYGTFYPGVAMALGVYTLGEAAALALLLAIVVSIIEIIIVWRFGYFGLSAPVGLLAYVYYISRFLTGVI
ncbi:sodium:calcium antiporter [Pyrobaculum ferrireducens]